MVLGLLDDGDASHAALLARAKPPPQGWAFRFSGQVLAPT
jgi:hypothetical protein